MTVLHHPVSIVAEPSLTAEAPAQGIPAIYRRDVAFVLALCAPLYLVIACAKAFNYAPLTGVGVGFPLKVAIIAYADLLFVTGWGVLGLIALLATAQLPRVHRVVRAAFALACVAMAAYGISSYQIYDAMRMQLTLPLLKMSGGWDAARSSLGSYVTVPFTTAALGGLVGYALVAFALMKVRLLERRWVWGVVALGVITAAPVLGYAHAKWIASGPKDGLARSPHWALLSSLASHAIGATETMEADAADAPPEYDRDFQTLAERGAQSNRPAAHFAQAGEVKNVIVVVLESTGTQFLSAYGANYRTTPNLDAELKHSLVFNSFYGNAAYTLHAMLPLSVSLYPGTGFSIYVSEYPTLPATSIAKVLKDRGYRTAFLTSQAMNYRNAYKFYENRGYDVFMAGEQYMSRDGAKELSSWGTDDVTLFDDLLRFIGNAGDAPFYAMTWTQQSHHPYPLAAGQLAEDMSPAAGEDAHGHAAPDFNAYLNTIRLSDVQLGRLFAMLRERGLADSTLVAITGDHGESFGFPHHWTFHGTSLYDEGVRVPLILWNPKLFSDEKRRETVGGHIDLNHTLLDILGIAPPGDWQGSSLFDPAHSNRVYFTCNTGNFLVGVREGSMKYIHNLTEGRGELYDLARDPTEQVNLAEQRSAEAKSYRQRLAAWMKYEKGKQQRISGNPSN